MERADRLRDLAVVNENIRRVAHKGMATAGDQVGSERFQRRTMKR